MIDFEKIGKYEVTGKLGQGSFGVVYRGRDSYLKRDVAIKVCSVADEGLRQRFFREAEISGKLLHKNIVTVYEFGFEGEIPYLVQEILSGEDLSRLVKRRAPLAPAAKLDILLKVAYGLGHAHAEGVIHRDVKPGNIRVLEDGEVKIMDFGIAKLASAETQLTQKGVTMGTASYLPPEQVRGADLDQRADIFSFGVLAYELMTYVRPFRGTTLSALIYQILYKVPQPMIDVWPQAPEPLSRLVARCLQKKPERRYASFSDLIPELAAVRDGVVAGRWPALQVATEAATPAADESQEPSSVVSPGAIARTARGVLEGKVGDYTISTAASAREVLRPPDEKTGHSTRPIDAVPAGEPAGAADQPSEVETVKTRLPPSKPASGGAAAEGGPASAAPEPDFDALATTAQEISDLVAQGDLEAAREQLEATMSRKDLSVPTPSSYERVDGSRKTRAIHAGEPAAEAPAEDAPTAAIPTSAAAASDTYRTVFRPPFDRLQWAGVAAAAVTAVALGWLLLRGGDAPVEPEPEPEPVAAAGEPVTGALAIHGAPWAEITEIAGADGPLAQLPGEVSTPFFLEVPPGEYTVTLRDPSSEGVVTCELEVTPNAITPCTAAFEAPSVTEFFKESGWWR